MSQRPRVEALYPLTPSQTGMWLRSAAQPGEPVFVEQAAFCLDGELNQPALERALQDVVRRHGALRSAILAKGQAPLRAVLRDMSITIREAAPRDGEDESAALTRIMDEDRRVGYQLNRPPLLRFILVRVAASRAWLVLSFHHVILDGWSLALFWAEAAACYQAERAGMRPALPPPPDERLLMEWFASRSVEGDQAYWQTQLAGFRAPTPIVGAIPQTEYEEPAEIEHVCPAAAGDALAAIARECRVPPALVFEVLWALLLAGRSGTTDVVFAATVSGRPASVAGVERMLGCFINTVPIRIRIAPEESLRTLLARHHEERTAQSEFEHCSAGQIHDWSELRASEPLAQSLLVYENVPAPVNAVRLKPDTPYESAVDTGWRPDHVMSGVEVEGAATRVRGAFTGYPLALLVSPGATPHLRCVYQPRAIDAAAVSALAREVEQLVTAMSPDAPVGELLGQVTPHQVVTPVAPARTARPPFVAPRTLHEHQLARIWEELFASGPVSVLDDFFALGGHSLLALQMAARVRAQLGYELPLQAIVTQPTIERLAGAISGNVPVAMAPVPLSATGDGMPIVCLHPLGGHVLCYAALGRSLGGAHRAWGLQAPGLEAGDTPADSWDALVTHHWEQMRRLPAAPFALVGYSYGGYLAIELAARAYRDGAAHVPVVLLDVPHPSVVPVGTLQPDAATLLHAMFGRDLGLELAAMRGATDAALVRLVYDAAVARRVLPPGTPIEQVERVLAVATAHSRLVPPRSRYDFPVALLRARDGAARISDAGDYGWSRFCTSLTVEWVSGSHETMLEPVHSSGVAAFLRRYLAETAVFLPRS